MQHSIRADDGHAELLGHTEWIRSLARRLVQDEARADDITQDVLLRGLGNAPREAGHLRAWLGTVVGHLVRERYRGETRRRGREQEASRHEAIRDHAELIGEAEAHQNLVDHVLALDDADRVALLQRYFQGLTPREIAAREGCTAAQVSHGLTRAHAALRARLEREGGRERWIAALVPLVSCPEPRLAASLAAPVLMSTGTFVTCALVALAALAVLLVRGLSAPPATPIPRIAPALDEETEAALERVAVPIEPGVRTSAAPQAIETPLSEAVAPPKESPPTSVKLRGRLVDTAGNPLPDQRVHLVRPLTPDITGPEFLDRAMVSKGRGVARVKTDEDGVFVMQDIPLGQYLIGPVSRRTTSERREDEKRARETNTPVHLNRNRQGRTFPVVEPIKISAETADEEVVVVAHFYIGRIGGLVQYPDGSPAHRISMRAYREDLEGSPVVSTGADGRFEFDSLPPGDYEIVGRPASRTSGWILPGSQPATAGDLSLVFTLERAAITAGHGYDAATGEGIDGRCWIAGAGTHPSAGLLGSKRLGRDDGGAFCFGSVPANVYHFVAFSDDKTRFGALRNVVVSAGQDLEDLKIPCYPAARIELDGRSSDVLVEVMVVESGEPIMGDWIQPGEASTMAVPPGRLELTFFDGAERGRPRTIFIETKVGETYEVVVPD